MYCCSHVFNKETPVLIAIRDTDGSWQFACGMDDAGECHLVEVGHLLDEDPELEQFVKLEKGTGARRDLINGGWKFFSRND